jgi:hypothetical protein
MDKKTEQSHSDIVIQHAHMKQLLERCTDAMRTTQQLIPLAETHLLMHRCREVEKWLDELDAKENP